jgi:glycosyltransferase involved in cell wall biosynthesis
MTEVDKRPILVLTPGGFENGGGIGRIVGYMVSAWHESERPPIKVVDTRGPKGLPTWPFFLAKGLLQILWYAPRQPLLHIHLASKGSTARKIIIVAFGKLLGLDMVLHLHDPDYGRFYERLPNWAQVLVRSMFNSVRRVIVLGTAAQEAVLNALPVPSEHIDIVPNAVPAPSPNRKSKYEGNPRILFLGHLTRRKGVQDLIKALARPEIKKLAWDAVLAGGGADQHEFVKQAETAGIGNRTVFPGWVDEKSVKELLETADILVLPSYAEGLPMSVLEGMAFGICIVCTPVGALAETVEDDITALIVQPGDLDGLAKALERCISDNGLRERLGERARAVCQQRFDIRTYPDKIMAVFSRARLRCDD